MLCFVFGAQSPKQVLGRDTSPLDPKSVHTHTQTYNLSKKRPRLQQRFLMTKPRTRICCHFGCLCKQSNLEACSTPGLSRQTSSTKGPPPNQVQLPPCPTIPYGHTRLHKSNHVFIDLFLIYFVCLHLRNFMKAKFLSALHTAESPMPPKIYLWKEVLFSE